MKRFGAIAFAVAVTAGGALTADVDAPNVVARDVEATTPVAQVAQLDIGVRSPGRTTVEADPYTVLKPWIGTYSHVVKTNSRFKLRLDGFEPRERVAITIDSEVYNTRVRRNGAGSVTIRAPRTAGKYQIVAVGRTSDAEADTTIRVRKRRR